MAEVRLSKKYSLQLPDVVRGALLAAGTTLLVFIQDWLSKDSDFDWKLALKVALGTIVSYLLKNGIFEKAKVITTADTNTKAVNATEKIKEVVN